MLSTRRERDAASIIFKRLGRKVLNFESAHFCHPLESLLWASIEQVIQRIMGTVTRIGHPSIRSEMSSESEEKAVEPSAIKLFDTPSKPNYHSSGFGKSSQQSIAVKEAAIPHSVGSPLLRYSLRRRSLSTVFPG